MDNKVCKYPGFLTAFAVGGVLYAITLINFLNEVL
jgi:hypothetical protein